MCGGQEVVINDQNSLKQQEQQTHLDLCMKQHQNHNQSNKDKKEEKKATHQHCLPNSI